MEIKKEKINVMLVDDSAVIRSIIRKFIETNTDIEVVGTASNGQMAVDAYKRLKPDVVILDVEMPVMDGISALKEILAFDPQAKVLMCSTLTQKNAQISMKAMQIGAIDCIAKPSNSIDAGDSEVFRKNLVDLLLSLGGAAKAMLPPTPSSDPAPSGARPTTGAPVERLGGMPIAKDIVLRKEPLPIWKPKIVMIGSSTGGPQALFEVMKNFADVKSVPFVLTQHMPKAFTELLAQHITQQCKIECKEGADGMVVEPGKAYLAPGGMHMTFEKVGLNLVIKLNDGPPENFCKPSVNPMYRSVLQHYRPTEVLGVMLTGMGHDGLDASREFADGGGALIAQDQQTSVVWGMPGAVATAGLCCKVLPLKEIGPYALRWLKG